MSELPGSWELEFHRRIVTFLARRGTLVVAQRHPGIWWQDWSGNGNRAKAHLLTCPLDAPKCTWKDEHWNDFNGTGEPDLHRTGVEAVVTCSCGHVLARRVRYDGGYAELMRAITRGEGTDEEGVT